MVIVVLPKSHHKAYVPSTPDCAPKVGISVGTVEEGLLRKNMSWVVAWANFVGCCEQGVHQIDLDTIFKEKSKSGKQLKCPWQHTTCLVRDPKLQTPKHRLSFDRTSNSKAANPLTILEASMYVGFCRCAFKMSMLLYCGPDTDLLRTNALLWWNSF